jgi:hypothetical protein
LDIHVSVVPEGSVNTIDNRTQKHPPVMDRQQLAELRPPDNAAWSKPVQKEAAPLSRICIKPLA